jgi:hypothetical protein
LFIERLASSVVLTRIIFGARQVVLGVKELASLPGLALLAASGAGMLPQHGFRAAAVLAGVAFMVGGAVGPAVLGHTGDWDLVSEVDVLHMGMAAGVFGLNIAIALDLEPAAEPKTEKAKAVANKKTE